MNVIIFPLFIDDENTICKPRVPCVTFDLKITLLTYRANASDNNFYFI